MTTPTATTSCAPFRMPTARTTITRCRSYSLAEGAWVTDVDGRRYLDMLAAYSAVNFGHSHPAARRRGGAPARPGHTGQPGVRPRPARPFCAALGELADKDMVLPMNTGAEAVETAIKTARKWGYEVKGVPGRRGGHRRLRRQLPRPHHHDRQLLHRPGRPRSYGPYTPGFRVVPYGDTDALAAAHGRPGGRRADRAHPGRGRGDRAPARLPGPGAGLCSARAR